jgi:hypothetical protein
MNREEKNKHWIEALKEKGISKIELDLVANKVKLTIHSLDLYQKFRQQMEDYISSYTSMSNHSFDTRLNINLIGLFVNEMSEMEISQFGFVHPLRTLKFGNNKAVVEMQAGIINVEVTEIEGETREGDTYWIKNP